MNTGANARIRFEHGRHETFPVRHGWLGKGLRRIRETGSFRPELETADALGLGSRMIKSLAYWLEASGLAAPEKTQGEDGKLRKIWRMTPLGETVARRDPHLEYPATWWLIHINLARRDGSVWGWFFNDFRQRVFGRSAATEAFARHLREKAVNRAQEGTVQRDAACLLLAYGAPVSLDAVDPEDSAASPLRDLGLVVRHWDTDSFEKVRPLDLPPPEAFLACCSAMPDVDGSGSAPLSDLFAGRYGPGRLFGLGGDAIEEAASTAASVHRAKGVSVTLLGAERHLSVPRIGPEAWLDIHFERIGAAA